MDNNGFSNSNDFNNQFGGYAPQTAPVLKPNTSARTVTAVVVIIAVVFGLLFGTNIFKSDEKAVRDIAKSEYKADTIQIEYHVDNMYLITYEMNGKEFIAGVELYKKPIFGHIEYGYTETGISFTEMKSEYGVGKAEFIAMISEMMDEGEFLE
jgi:hypothetical protein